MRGNPVHGYKYWVMIWSGVLHTDMFCFFYRIAQRRSDGVAVEVNKKLSQMDSKKVSKKEKDDRWVWITSGNITYSHAIID